MWIYGLTVFMEIHHLAKFGGHSYCNSRNMFLVCHVIKQDHVIKGLGEYNDRNPSEYVPLLPGLVVIGTVVVEI